MGFSSKAICINQLLFFITTTFILSVTTIIILFAPFALGSSLVGFPTPAITTNTYIFHLQYDCPSMGCTGNDEMIAEIIFNDVAGKATFTPTTISFSWVQPSDYTIDPVSTPMEPVAFTNHITNHFSIGFSQSFPAGTTLLAEIVLGISTISPADITTYQPQIQITISTDNSEDTLVQAPIDYIDPLFQSTEVPTLHILHIDTESAIVTDDDGIPTTPIVYNQLHFNLHQFTTTIRAIRIYPLFGLTTTFQTLDPVDYPTISCELNTITYPIAIKRTATNEIYFEIDNIDIISYDYQFVFFIGLKFIDQPSIETVKPSPTSPFGMIITFYSTPIADHVDGNAIYSHIFSSNQNIDPNDNLRIFALNKDFFLHHIPTLIPFRAYFDPIRHVALEASEGLDSTTTMTTQSSTPQPQQQAQSHLAYIYSFASDGIYNTLTANRLANCYFTARLQFAQGSIESHSLSVQSPSWAFYAVLIYSVRVDEVTTQRSVDIPINNGHLVSQNLTNYWESIPFRLLRDDILDEIITNSTLGGSTIDTHDGDLFLIPPKIRNSNSFTVIGTQFKLSFDFPLESAVSSQIYQSYVDINPGATYQDDLGNFNNELLSEQQLFSGLQPQQTQGNSDGVAFNPTISIFTSYGLKDDPIGQRIPHPADLLWYNVTSVVSRPNGRYAETSPYQQSHFQQQLHFQQQSNNQRQYQLLQTDEPSTVPFTTDTLNATMILYPHNLPITTTYDPSSFTNKMKPIDEVSITINNPSQPQQSSQTLLQSLSSYLFNTPQVTQQPQQQQQPQPEPQSQQQSQQQFYFSTQQIIDESTPQSVLDQWTFALHFRTNLATLKTFHLGLYSSQYVFFGSFTNCTLNGVKNVKITDQFEQELLFPNIYQTIIVHIPDGVDPLAPTFPRNERKALDGKIEFDDHGENPPNKLVCMHYAGTILKLSTLYKEDGTALQDPTNVDGDGTAVNIHHGGVELNAKRQSPLSQTIQTMSTLQTIQQQLQQSGKFNPLISDPTTPQFPFAKSLDLPYYNPTMPEFTHLPIVLFSKDIATITSTSNLNLVPVPDHIQLDYSFHIYHSYTMFPEVPPRPPPSGGLSKATWVAITVICVVGMVGFSAIPITIFVLDWLKTKKERAKAK